MWKSHLKCNSWDGKINRSWKAWILAKGIQIWYILFQNIVLSHFELSSFLLMLALPQIWRKKWFKKDFKRVSRLKMIRRTPCIKWAILFKSKTTIVCKHVTRRHMDESSKSEQDGQMMKRPSFCRYRLEIIYWNQIQLNYSVIKNLSSWSKPA